MARRFNLGAAFLFGLIIFILSLGISTFVYWQPNTDMTLFTAFTGSVGLALLGAFPAGYAFAYEDGQPLEKVASKPSEYKKAK